MKKILHAINKYKIFILSLVIFYTMFNIKLPYYILAPGGTINLSDRLNSNTNGSINLLYVSEYQGNIITYLMGKALNNWDIGKKEDITVSDESYEEINKRNKIMLDNAYDIATIVAYKTANKEIKISNYENIVIATTKDNGLEIGDIIKSVNNKEVVNVNEIKNIIKNTNVGDKISFKIIRNNKERIVNSYVYLENDNKLIGAVIITNYDYEVNPRIDIKFKDSEGGASGGLMTTLAIYNELVDKDILKGRNIGGTGTISLDGTVGEIDGIKYKVIGAVKNKLDLIFVPTANYDEAIRAKKENNYDIEIIKVESFNEVLDYLINN